MKKQIFRIFATKSILLKPKGKADTDGRIVYEIALLSRTERQTDLVLSTH